MPEFKIKFFENLKKLKKQKKKFKQDKIFWESAGYTLEKKENIFHIFNKDIHLSSFSPNLLFTATSVLINNEYNFSINEPYVMIDIGYNIGITSLIFAQNENIKQIYGFEPFKPTYNNALENLSQNPLLSSKIRLYNYGLGNREHSFEAGYNKERIGSMSTIKDRFADNCDSREKVIIKDAAKELKKILDKHNEKIFFKIDCEGAEIEIIPSLSKANLLQRADIIIMEWHFEYPEEILKILEQNGFLTFCTIEPASQTGIIRAVNKNK